MSTSTKTYVFGDLEVKLTGRTAERQIKSSRRKDVEAKAVLVHEITPADIEEGSWKKWVKMTDLYEIVDNK